MFRMDPPDPPEDDGYNYPHDPEDETDPRWIVDASELPF